MRRSTVVSMSSALSICSDRYGFTRKKSKESAAVTAASAPPKRPATTAPRTTKTTRINARFVLTRSSRSGTNSAATAIGANAARATLALWLSRYSFTIPVYAHRDTESRALTRP